VLYILYHVGRAIFIKIMLKKFFDSIKEFSKKKN